MGDESVEGSMKDLEYKELMKKHFGSKFPDRRPTGQEFADKYDTAKSDEEKKEIASLLLPEEKVAFLHRTCIERGLCLEMA